MLEMIAAELGVSSQTAAIILLAFFVLIIVALFRRYRYKLIVSEATKNSPNGSTWRVAPTNISPQPNKSRPTNQARPTSPARPTDIELPKAIIKQLQVVVADAGKLKALFAKIDKLDTIASDIGRLENLITRIYGLEHIVTRIEKLQLPSDDKPDKVMPSIDIKIDRATNTDKLNNIPPVKPVLQQVANNELFNLDRMRAEGKDLPEDLHGFYEVVITKNVWEKSEMRRTALKNGLMHNNAIDRLNEWADEKYRDQLIVKDEGQFIVQRDIFDPNRDNDV